MIQRSPALRLPEFTRQFFVTTDASDVAAGGGLSQIHPSGEHPVAYLSRKLSDTERQWPAHENELFAIKFCLEKWRPYLLGSQFTVYTDSIACMWFFTKKQPSPKRLRWFDLFGQFTFEVYHRAGRTNVVADIRSRPIQFSAVLVTEPDPALATRIGELYLTDSECKPLLSKLQRGTADDSRYQMEHGLIVVCVGGERRVLLPRDDKLLLDVLVQYHHEATAAHPWVLRTYLPVRQDFVWPRLRSTDEDYVCTCETCQRNKSGDRKRGVLHPLPIPDASWVDVSMDLVTGLPESGGFDAICVIVCRVSKRAHYLPTRKAADAAEIAKTFFDQIIIIHGLPRSIVSDRDPRFLSHLWQELMSTLNVQLRMTVAHRAQADGQSERQIKALEDALRYTVSYYGDAWSQRLPSIEFAHASLVSTSTSKAPIEVDTRRYGSGFLNKNLSSPDYDISQDPTKNKLLPCWIGPLPIAKRIGTNAYKLVLPTFVGRPIRRVALVIYDNQIQQANVVAVQPKKRRSRGRTQYLVKWADLPESPNSWENVGSISHVSHWEVLLAKFRERHQQTLLPPKTTSF
ncbi:Retrovirus Polyprotein [Phytophthora megakarya]|uniref:Retrovirus Polyprotein n=1 Tax=Phytophthora megakarya TaxID=4795 RepID=A0A225WR71_9STRA|nr:Retrovirus Polyprotein [Phytophthora megakarya]